MVHAGAASAGAMLLAIAVPSQWVTLSPALQLFLGIGLIGGAYALCTGMFMAAIWGTRGIPGGGSALNKLVAVLYALGTALTFVGGILLVIGLLRTLLAR
ncbi:MAG: hypothetical protein ABW136_10070 [Steroidobacteraceae bacterium]